MLLINQENQEHDYIFILNKFEDCWDECLKSALLEKVKDKELKPKCMGQLLEKIIKHESNKTREFAKSLIYFPLPSIGDERERTIIASKVLAGLKRKSRVNKGIIPVWHRFHVKD